MRYYCSKCNEDIMEKEYNYSKEHYGKILCRACQGNNQKIRVSKFSKRGDRVASFKKRGGTPEARELYNVLKIMGIDAELEKYDGYKTIDIAIPSKMVNIEIDGMQHSYNSKQALSDLKRTYYSFKKGYVTLRIPNSLIKNNLHETATYIAGFLKSSEDRLEEDLEEEESQGFFSFLFGR